MYQENKTPLTTQQEDWTWKTYPLKGVGRLFLSDCSEEGKQELAKINLTFQCKQSLPLFDIKRFSSWRRLVGVTAWILRFTSKSRRVRHQKSQETGNNVLEPEEISNVERYWVQDTQTERFSEELTTLIKRKRKRLEKQSAVEIFTICGQWWNLRCRWETSNVESTLGCQTLCHIAEETTHLKICHRPHP